MKMYHCKNKPKHDESPVNFEILKLLPCHAIYGATLSFNSQFLRTAILGN